MKKNNKLEKGKNLIEKGKLWEAKNEFLRVKKAKDIEASEIHLELANVFILLGDYDTAHNFLMEIEESFFMKTRLEYLKGCCYLGFNQIEKAKKHFDNSLITCKNDFLQEAMIKIKIAKYYAIKGFFQKQLNILENISAILEKATGKKKKELFDLNNKEKTNKNLALLIAELAEHYGFFFGNIYDIEKAKSYHATSLEIRKSVLSADNPNHYLIAIGLNNLGFCFRKEHNFDKAIEYHLEVMAYLQNDGFTDDKYYYFARIYFNLGICYRELTQYSKALIEFDRCKNIRLFFFKENHRYLAKVYTNKGRCYRKQGDCTKAQDSFKRALNEYKKTYKTEIHPNIAKILVDIGLSYFVIGYYEKALKNYEKALQITNILIEQQGEISEKKTKGTILCHIGQTYQKLDQNKKAIEYFNRAINLSSIFDKGTCYFHLGSTYFDNKKYLKSIVFYNKVLPIYLSNLGNQDPRLLKLHNFLGEAYLYVNKLEKAYYHFREAEKGFLEGYHIFSQGIQRLIVGGLNKVPIEYQRMFRRFRLIKQVNKRRIFETWVGLANYYYACYKKTGKVSNLSIGLSFFRNYIINITDNMLETCNPVELRRSFALKCKKAYNVAIKIAFALHKEHPNDDKYIRYAYEFIEKSKNVILAYDLLKLLIKQQNIDKQLISRIQKLNYQIAEIEIKTLKTNGQADGMPPDKWKTHKNGLSKILNENENELKKKHPDYYRLKYNRKPILLKKVQRNLKPNTIILNYFHGEDALFLIAITAKKVVFEQLVADEKDIYGNLKIKKLEEVIKSFKKGLWHNVMEVFHPPASTLYEFLITPIEELLTEESQLVILPDGDLHNMPFAALVREKYDWKLPKLAANELPYLIRKWGLFYQFSTTFLFYDEMLGISTEHLKDKTYNGFAVINHTHDKDFKNASPLTQTLVENKRVANIFQKRGYQATIWENATKKDFLEHANKTQYLLIATHGIMDENGNPCLIFADDGKNTHRLTLKEFIKLLRLKTDIVILSSCVTGYGEIHPGEGVVSLSKGVLYAGAVSCVSTFHSVDEKIAVRFSESFMEQLLVGDVGRVEAIRQTQIELIRDKTVVPREWAIFFLKSKWKCFKK